MANHGNQNYGILISDPDPDATMQATKRLRIASHQPGPTNGRRANIFSRKKIATMVYSQNIRGPT
jgi:hypothetical protein